MPSAFALEAASARLVPAASPIKAARNFLTITPTPLTLHQIAMTSYSIGTLTEGEGDLGNLSGNLQMSER
jgi:hypothetical protein